MIRVLKIFGVIIFFVIFLSIIFQIDYELFIYKATKQCSSLIGRPRISYEPVLWYKLRILGNKDSRIKDRNIAHLLLNQSTLEERSINKGMYLCNIFFTNTERDSIVIDIKQRSYFKIKKYNEQE